jgi:hypothetical protein
MKRIVCDTSPLLHLGEAGARDLLSAAGDVHITIAVDLEIRSYEADWHGSSLWVSPSVLRAAKAALNQMA